MATKEVFETYLGEGFITSERLLKDGKYIKHMSHCPDMQVTAKDDTRVKFFTNEALEAYLEFVEGNEE